MRYNWLIAGRQVHTCQQLVGRCYGYVQNRGPGVWSISRLLSCFSTCALIYRSFRNLGKPEIPVLDSKVVKIPESPEFESVPEGTRLTLNPHGLMKLLATFTARGMERNIESGLQNIKAVRENQSGEAAS